MKYRLLQKRIKVYRQAGYTSIRLNEKKTVLEREYNRLLQLNLSQTQLEKAINNRSVEQIAAIDPLAVYASPQDYRLQQIKEKVFHLAQVKTTKELRQNYPLIAEQNFNFRYHSAWVKCLQLITTITEHSRANAEFYQAVEIAIEIEIKSRNDEFYRYETPDSDLYTLLLDNNLIGAAWEKNKSSNAALKRAYILRKCCSAGLDPHEYSLA